MLTALLLFGLFSKDPEVIPPTPPAPKEVEQVLYQGDFTQGGLVELTAPANSTIYVDNKGVEGFGNKYYVAYGREAAPVSNLSIIYPSGASQQFQLPIEQRLYKTQNVNNVNDELASPRSDSNRVIIEKEAFALAAARHMASHPCPGKFNFIRPSAGRISGVFGSQRVYNGKPGKPHSGVDFAMPEGTPAYSPESGRIIYIEDMMLTGKTMAIDHGCGIVSTFMHLSAAEKNVGDTVQKGEMVARIGKTGLASGAHLHWSLNLGATRLDPLLVLE